MKMTNRKTAFVAILIGALASSEAGARLCEVTASALNVRSSPTTRSRVVKVLKRHQAINVVDRKGDWRKIDRPVTGWVLKTYIRDGLIRYVKAGAVNVRRSPSTSAGIGGARALAWRARCNRLSGPWDSSPRCPQNGTSARTACRPRPRRST